MQSAAPVNPDRRVLPPGWTEGYNPQKDTWYYVQTNVVPARISYYHPSTEYYAESNRVDDPGPSSGSSYLQHQGSSSSQSHNEKIDSIFDKNSMLYNTEPIASSSSSSELSTENRPVAPTTSSASSIYTSSSPIPASESTSTPSQSQLLSVGQLTLDSTSVPATTPDSSLPPEYSIYSEPSDELTASPPVAASEPDRPPASVVSPPEYNNPSFLSSWSESSLPPASQPSTHQVAESPSPSSISPDNSRPVSSVAVNVSSTTAPDSSEHRPDSTGVNSVNRPSQAQAVNMTPLTVMTGHNPHVPNMNLVHRPSQASISVSPPSHTPMSTSPVTMSTAPLPPTVSMPTNAPTTTSSEGLTLAQRLYASAFASRPPMTVGPSGRISTSPPGVHGSLESHMPATVSLAAVSAEAYNHNINNFNNMNINNANAAIANSFYKTGVLQNLQNQHQQQQFQHQYQQQYQQHRPQGGRSSYHTGNMNYAASNISLVSTLHSSLASATSGAGMVPQLPPRPTQQLQSTIVRPQSQKIEHYSTATSTAGRPASMIFRPNPTSVPSVTLVARPPSQGSGLVGATSIPNPLTASTMNSQSAIAISPSPQPSTMTTPMNTAMQGQIGVSGIQSPPASIAQSGTPLPTFTPHASPPLGANTSGSLNYINSGNNTATLPQHSVIQNSNEYAQTGSMVSLPSPSYAHQNPLPPIPPTAAASTHSSNISLGHVPQLSTSSQTSHSSLQTSTSPINAPQSVTNPLTNSTSPAMSVHSSPAAPIPVSSSISSPQFTPTSVPQLSAPSLPQRPSQRPPQRPPQHPSYTLPALPTTHSPRPPRPNSSSFSFGSTSSTLSNTGNMLANFGKAAGRVAGRAALRYAGRFAIGSVLGTAPTLLSTVSDGGLFDSSSLDVLSSSLANLDVTSTGVDMSQFQAAFQGVPGTDYQGIINSIGQQQQTSPTPGVNYPAVIQALMKIQHAAVQVQNQNTHATSHANVNANPNSNAGVNNYQAIVNAQAQQIQQMQAMMNSLNLQQHGQQVQSTNMQTVNPTVANHPLRPPQTQSHSQMQHPPHTQTQFSASHVPVQIPTSHAQPQQSHPITQLTQTHQQHVPQGHPSGSQHHQHPSIAHVQQLTTAQHQQQQAQPSRPSIQHTQPVHISPPAPSSFPAPGINSSTVPSYHQPPQSVHGSTPTGHGQTSPPPPPPLVHSTMSSPPQQQPSHPAAVQTNSRPSESSSFTSMLSTVGHGLMNAVQQPSQPSQVSDASHPNAHLSQHYLYAQQQQQAYHTQQLSGSANHSNVNGDSGEGSGGSGGQSMINTVGHEALNLWHHHQQHEHQEQMQQQVSQAYSGGGDSNSTSQSYDTSLLNGGNPYNDENPYIDGSQNQPLMYDSPPDFNSIGNSFGFDPSQNIDFSDNGAYDMNLNSFVGAGSSDPNASQFGFTDETAGMYEYSSYTSNDQSQQSLAFGTDGQGGILGFDSNTYVDPGTGNIFQNTDTTFVDGNFVESVDTTNIFDNSGDLLFSSTDETTFIA
ncbi:hypothetical protein J3R30DRAFT_3522664 [Lentinula aciculospora]|uniref:WW domain-containing protein n=1 Tax=Lentinula aciculospora TaxID=153920 RepID=A0A9W9DJG8_9AGAR|nr:hypothetical protein J3R30DRAFT_3522664 [Lentinula aciculospora]